MLTNDDLESDRSACTPTPKYATHYMNSVNPCHDIIFRGKGSMCVYVEHVSLAVVSLRGLSGVDPFRFLERERDHPVSKILMLV